MATVELYPAGSEARQIWQNALDLIRHLEGDWTLIGGLMVQLHAERYGRTGARATNDTDILANSRTRPSGTSFWSQRPEDRLANATVILPDVMKPGLTVAFCGTAAGTRSAQVGAYYAGPGNAFWATLHRIGLTPRELRPNR